MSGARLARLLGSFAIGLDPYPQQRDEGGVQRDDGSQGAGDEHQPRTGGGGVVAQGAPLRDRDSDERRPHEQGQGDARGTAYAGVHGT